MPEPGCTTAATTSPTATSANAEAPTPLAIEPDTPVVDLESGLVGKVVAVAPAFCVFAVEEALCICPWRQLAVGNIAPARETLPPDLEDHDKRNWQARVLRELEGLKPLGLSPVLRAAYDELLHALTERSSG